MCFDKWALLETKAREGGGKTGVSTHTVTYSVKKFEEYEGNRGVRGGTKDKEQATASKGDGITVLRTQADDVDSSLTNKFQIIWNY